MHALSLSMRISSHPLSTSVLLGLAFVTAGCGHGDDPSSTGASDTGPATCLAGETPLDDGRCQPAGLPQDMPCPPGEVPLDDDRCQPPGVPPEACGKGFAPDGRAGCSPILPEDPCPPGQIAVPGDTACREVAPCGDGDYGMIPVDATTQFVNAAYTGDDSDGTQARPWKRIQDGIDHARAAAIVAVAAGSYPEELWLHERPVRLWGRCPALVEVVGTGTYSAIEISSGDGSSDASEVHDLAITGTGGGILTQGASDLLVERVWIHGTLRRGIGVQGLSTTPSSITVRGSLIEATTDVGVFVGGSRATIEGTVVRDTLPPEGGQGGSGIVGVRDPTTGERAEVTLRTSLLDGNEETGVLVHGTRATIEGTVVRNTRPRSNDRAFGDGILVEEDPEIPGRAELALRSSLLEHNHEAGLRVSGSDATVEATIVRATQPGGIDEGGGQGVRIEPGPETRERAKVSILASLLEQNHEAGAVVSGSDARIESTVVRDTLPRKSDGTGGDGILAALHEATNGRATLTLRASLIERNHRGGVHVAGSDAMIESTVVRDTLPQDIDETDGTGVTAVGIVDGTAQERANLTLRRSLVEGNHLAGVVVQSSDAEIASTVVRGTQPQKSDGASGVGIVVQDRGAMAEDPLMGSGRSTLMLQSSLLEQNHSVGLYVSGSDAVVDWTIVRDTQMQKSDRRFGRGIYVEQSSESTERGMLTLRASLVEGNHEAGVFVFDSDATIGGSVVRATRSNGDGMGGDGIAVISDGDPAAATITKTHVVSNARAGISSFSAAISLVSSVVQCNRINLNGEDVVAGRSFSFDAGQDNLCGCETPAQDAEVCGCPDPEPLCPVTSATLSVPGPSSWKQP